MLHPPLAGALTAATAGLFVYLNTLPAGFTFDDNFAVVRNKDVVDDGMPLHALLGHDFWGQPLSSDQSHKSYRPLTVLCFRLTRQAWQALPLAWTAQVTAWRMSQATGGLISREEQLPPGLDPLPFHAVNVLLHALASALVCWLAYHLLHVRLALEALQRGAGNCMLKHDRQEPASASVKDVDREDCDELAASHPPSLHRLLHLHLPAWASGLAFALHPAHTEAVAGVVGQAELLCACLCLPALLLYFAAARCDNAAAAIPIQSSVHRRQTWGAGWHWMLLAAAMLLTLAAALCKEIGITVVGCMIVYDVLLVPLRGPAASPKPPINGCKQEGSSKAHGAGGAKHALDKQAGDAEAAAAAARRQAPGATVIPQAEDASRTAARGKAPCSAPVSPPALAAVSSVPASEGAGRLRALVLQRKWMRMAVALLVVLLYVRARSALAGDQLVRIYRKVENPIPFLPSLKERLLNTGYLHVRYAGLLLWPQHLSADWSYACVQLVEKVLDWRNMATVLLYGYLLLTALAARVWLVPVAWWRESAHGDKAGFRCTSVSGWRLVVLLGLTVGPFFPASNVLFYVGTFIGERLLYLPSVGAMLLVCEAVFACAMSSLIKGARAKSQAPSPQQPAAVASQPPTNPPPASDPKAQAGRSSTQHSLWRERCVGALCTLLAVLVGVVVVVALVVAAGRTWRRNWDWMTEETLFVSAQQVCGASAKVALNSGILARRHRAHAAALRHFEDARRLEPGFCEPGYWIGSTLINMGQVNDGIMELERALACKWVAAEALSALNTLYQVMQASAPGTGYPMARWGALLAQASVGHVAEGCEVLEAAAGTYLEAGDASGAAQALAVCEQALEREAALATPVATCKSGQPCPSEGSLASRTKQLTGPAAGRLLRCVQGRRQVYRSMIAQGPDAPEPRVALYTYLNYVMDGAGDCRRNANEWLDKYGVMPHGLKPQQAGATGSTPVDVVARTAAGHDDGSEALYTPSAHMQLVHRLQSQDAEDPWLHMEWGTILSRVPGRGGDAAVHMSVAGVLFLQWVQADLKSAAETQRLAGLRSLSGEPMSVYNALVAAADALWDAYHLTSQHGKGRAAQRLSSDGIVGSACDLFQRSLDARAAAVAKAPDASSREVQQVKLHNGLRLLQLHMQQPTHGLLTGTGHAEEVAHVSARHWVGSTHLQLNCTSAQLEQLQVMGAQLQRLLTTG